MQLISLTIKITMKILAYGVTLKIKQLPGKIIPFDPWRRHHYVNTPWFLLGWRKRVTKVTTYLFWLIDWSSPTEGGSLTQKTQRWETLKNKFYQRPDLKCIWFYYWGFVKDSGKNNACAHDLPILLCLCTSKLVLYTKASLVHTLK